MADELKDPNVLRIVHPPDHLVGHSNSRWNLCVR
jgi:hypothetical protein